MEFVKIMRLCKYIQKPRVMREVRPLDLFLHFCQIDKPVYVRNMEWNSSKSCGYANIFKTQGSGGGVRTLDLFRAFCQIEKSVYIRKV